jgi:Cation transporter/ATPase, N-terminus
MNVIGNGRRNGVAAASAAAHTPPDPLEPAARLFRDLRSRPGSLSAREVERRLTEYGPNEITRRGRRHWWREVGLQLTIRSPFSFGLRRSWLGSPARRCWPARSSPSSS